MTERTEFRGPRRKPARGGRGRRSRRPAGRAAARRRADPALVGHHADGARRSRLAGVLGRPPRARRQRVGTGRRLLARRVRGDVVAIARALDEPPALVGASLGGLSSLAAIGEHPDETVARALVLVDVAPRIEEAGRDAHRRVHDGAHGDRIRRSLDEVADAIQRYNPHRPRPTNLGGLEKNLRQRDDGRWYWHWDPAFITGRLGGPDETRVVARRSGAAAGRRRERYGSRRCSCAAA